MIGKTKELPELEMGTRAGANRAGPVQAIAGWFDGGNDDPDAEVSLLGIICLGLVIGVGVGLLIF